MKRFLLLLSVFIFSWSFGQQKVVFKPLRYDDDFSYLKNDTLKSDYEKVKFASINTSGNIYVSFGGDIRFQYFNIKNEDWGDTAYDKDGFILSRYLVHADFHVANHFRLFLQLQDSNANGRSNPSLVENSPLDLHQLFVDLKPLPALTLRAGRQELSFGSQRLVAVRELPNNRAAFDGMKIDWIIKNVKSSLFYSHPVVNREQVFDDRFNKETKFWGSYTVLNKVPFLENIDAYYLGLWRRNGVFDDAEGRELRHSVGTRIWKNSGLLKYDFEAVYQFGTIGSQNISAWTVSSNTSYQLQEIKFKPTLGLKTEIISGNKSYDDRTIETFNPLFPRGAYFGLAALIGPSNLMDVHPSLNLEISEKVYLSFDYDAFWRYSTNDGIYAANTHLIYTGKGTSDRFIGTQLGVELGCQFSDMLFIKLEGTWFRSGNYIKESSAGKDIVMAGLTTQFKF